MHMIKYTSEAVDAIEKDKIRNARTMSPERKLRTGLELFDLNRALILAALKMQHPEADAAALRQLYLERLAVVRRLDTSQ